MSDEPPDASPSPPPSHTLAIVGAVLFSLSIVALAAVAVRAITHVMRDRPPGVGGQVETPDPKEPPTLPESFPAASSREELFSTLELDYLWSTTHPEYDGEIRVLITSAPIEGMSPNYSAAFYRHDGDAFTRIGGGFGFGGYHPPELGRHPTLDIPAIVCVAEAIPERTYFFVLEGAGQTLQENGETWRPVEELR